MYSIDTSALIEGWLRAYPPDTFPTLWEQHIDGLIQSGRLKASDEVLEEISKKDDELRAWCEGRDDFFVELEDSIQDALIGLMQRYPKLVGAHNGKNAADPVVISLAISRIPALTVVTQEDGGSERKPKIPYICRNEGVRCITLLDLIREQGWTFR
ncbi:MAG: DUF4411 family protein [Sedimenticola sp.]